MQRPIITDQEFARFQRFIFEEAGITMSSSKQALVSGRLAKRLEHCGLDSYTDYFNLLSSGEAAAEVQTAVDLLTTNETYFFREGRHFEVLRAYAVETMQHSGAFNVWSAACSSGEEPYSIAMTLSDCLGESAAWSVLGSDISTAVLARARRGHYPLERARLVPPPFLQRYCLKGTGEQEGTLLVSKALRNRVQYAQVNLNEALPGLGTFNMVFLRNVMIYFSKETKRDVVRRIAGVLRPGGLLCIGHSESLHDIAGPLESVGPSLYRKPKDGR